MTPKTTLSVGRLVSALQCGRLGKALMDGLQIEVNPAMARGTKFHEIMEAWANGIGKLPDGWAELLPSLDSIIGVEERKKMAIHNIPLDGVADILTAEATWELKSGKIYEWHKDQVRAYNRMFNRLNGWLVYVDLNTVVPVEGAMTDEEIVKAWDRIAKAEPERCSKCQNCPVKKTCPEFNSYDNPKEIDDLLYAMTELEEQKAILAHKKAQIEPIVDAVRYLTDKVEEIKGDIKKLDPKNYIGFTGSVRVSNRKMKVIMGDPSELRPFAQYPHLWHEPKPKLKEMKDEVGVEVNQKVVMVTMK